MGYKRAFFWWPLKDFLYMGLHTLNAVVTKPRPLLQGCMALLLILGDMLLLFYARPYMEAWNSTMVGSFRLTAFLLVIVGFQLNCHRISLKKSDCVPEPFLNAAFWVLIIFSFVTVLGGVVHDLHRKRRLEQRLPKHTKAIQEDATIKRSLQSAVSFPLKRSAEDAGQKLRWFWLNLTHTRLANWFQTESLLDDAATVEESMARWFSRTFPGAQLPVNHFHLVERPQETVQFLEQILNDEPAFLGYLISIPLERSEVLSPAHPK